MPTTLCKTCADPIPPRRLIAMPFADQCVRCAAAGEEIESEAVPLRMRIVKLHDRLEGVLAINAEPDGGQFAIGGASDTRGGGVL